MNACYLSNNGIGDNLYSIGALRYLLNFYKSVYFVCRDIYLNKIKQFFIDTNNIICIPFSGTKKLEVQSCKKIIDKTNNTFVEDFITLDKDIDSRGGSLFGECVKIKN